MLLSVCLCVVSVVLTHAYGGGLPSTSYYVTFWALSLYDLAVPEERYREMAVRLRTAARELEAGPNDTRGSRETAQVRTQRAQSPCLCLCIYVCDRERERESTDLLAGCVCVCVRCRQSLRVCCLMKERVGLAYLLLHARRSK
jgi:hypothetical protein